MSKLSDNDEVKSFVEAVKQISGGELKNKDSYKRDIKSDDLKLKAAYGSGEDFGIDKVEIICFGNITLVDEGEYFIITSPIININALKSTYAISSKYHCFLFRKFRLRISYILKHSRYAVVIYDGIINVL